MARAIQIIAADNVATLLDDCPAGQEIIVTGGAPGTRLRALEHVAEGHKVALRAIAEGAGVIKFGTQIGHATALITAGAWVHLHNLASTYDSRSQSLDVQSGAPADTVYR
jgi:altronate dehydratase small subunit